MLGVEEVLDEICCQVLGVLMGVFFVNGVLILSGIEELSMFMYVCRELVQGVGRGGHGVRATIGGGYEGVDGGGKRRGRCDRGGAGCR